MINQNELSAFMNFHLVIARVEQKILHTIEEVGGPGLHSLSSRQNKAMLMVSHHEICYQRGVTLNELAGMLTIQKSAASLLVSSLVRKKLLCRSVDPLNRRFVKIVLSAKGRKLLEDTLPFMQDKIANLLDQLDDQERRTFVNTAGKLYRYIFEPPKGQA